ncbi:MAG: alpha/beta hydrolase-fold protein [Clostridia bacterium]|nr:alpha/beta hydrolase-fold protein [Clostridia bacterium]
MKTKWMLYLVLALGLLLSSAGALADGGLTGLTAEDPAQRAVLAPEFSPEVTDYYMYVQSDVYGIRFTPTFEGDAPATVTMVGTGVEETTEEVASGSSFILNLSQAYEDMRTDVESTATIEANGVTYTVKVQREDANYLYDAFTLNTKATEDGNEMYYWLHVPEDYDPSREYPVVLYLHGSGQRFQNVEMVLMRNQAATSFVKYGYDAIVIAPQCNYTDLSAEIFWYDTDLNATVFGNGAYSILQDVIAQYNTDADRIYVTGLSMGGIASYGMLAQYPETFAAALIHCGLMTDVGLDKFITSMAEYKTPMWITHGTGDESVDFENYGIITGALDEAGIDYTGTVYDDDVFLYPMRHFCWEPAYADQDVLNWLFSQSKSNSFGTLVDLKVEDPSFKATPAFSTDVYDYSIDVQHDVYGVRFTPYGEGPFKINGEAVGSGESYVFEFSASDRMPKETYYTGLTGVVEIETSQGVYTYTINKEAIGDIVDAFEQRTYTLPDGGEMYYLLYVPEDYDASNAYPVVLCLHGSGKRWQVAENILMSNQCASAFVKYGEKSIIVVPQCNYTDISPDMTEGWADRDLQMSKFGVAAFDILQNIKAEFNIDASREYVTGLSMGGNGSLSMIANYPDEFAAAIINCSYGNDFGKLANLVGSDTAIWLAQAENDPAVRAENYYRITKTLDELGVPYTGTLIQKHNFLHTSDHFCWVPMYANYEGCLDWMFEQTK